MRLIPAIAAAICAILLVSHIVLTAAVSNGTPESVLGAAPPGNEPEPFLPETILDGVHSAPSFTPDGTEMYWSWGYVPEGRRSRIQHIFTSQFADGKWSAPELVSFSGGRYSDGGPFVSPDGLRLFFYSSRPTETQRTPADEDISVDIWYVERNGEDWGEPQRLWFNTDQYEGMQSVADNGNIYFQSNRRGTRGVFDVYVSELIDGKYAAPKTLGPAVNCPKINMSPLIAPDESYVILSYSNNAPNNGLHISFRTPGGGWTKAIGMGQRINATPSQRFPGLTPDGKYLFFTRSVSRKSGVYWVDARIIVDLSEQVLGK
jgi:Tol biopolymer transport system component